MPRVSGFVTTAGLHRAQEHDARLQRGLRARAGRRARRRGRHLVGPGALRPEELEPAIELAVARFTELTAASREAAALRQALAERKLIERAKGLLMRALGVTEAEAFRMLQKTAMDRRVTMAGLAEAFLRGEARMAAPGPRGERGR